MNTNDSCNAFATVLREQGRYVVNVEGIEWYDYNGFMMPAYFPHCCPPITPDIARNVVKISGRPFVRWDSRFGQFKNGQWWYVNHRQPWAVEQCSGNTRSKIKRGRKYLHARMATIEEMSIQGYNVCEKAAQRYEKDVFLPSKLAFQKKLHAATHNPETFQFFGVFCDEKLVGFSENYIQHGGVFWESIWYDPEFLRNYSSYVLTCEMLNHYLNMKKLEYVSDGCRSIFHRTAVQDFFLDKFGFRKEYALLNVVYSAKLRMAVQVTYPLRTIVWAFSNQFPTDVIDKVGGILRQEYIRKECEKQRISPQ